MNIYDIEILLIGMLVSALSFTLFIYKGNIILDFLKISDMMRIPLNKQDLNTEASSLGKRRRKIGSKPGVVCSLPIHREGRQEAPLY